MKDSRLKILPNLRPRCLGVCWRSEALRSEPGSTQLTLWGTIPVDDTGANEGLAIEDPAEFAATLFRRLLEVRGIAIYGKDRTRHTELANLTTFTSTVVAGGGGGDHALTSPAG